LTNATEKGYQIPFSQVLVIEGHTVLYVSKHGQLEQGKDIISLDAKGIPCAYQLKAGDINLQEWREIESQIHELVELPPVHPSIDKAAPFKAYLVTNGEVGDTVRRLVDDRNTAWEQKGLPILHLMTKGELLRKFIDAHQTFLPEALPSQRNFLELYLANGRDFVNKEKLAAFLEDLLLQSGRNDSYAKLCQRVAAAAVITQLILTPFELENNHVSILECWTMFCAYVLAMSEQRAMPGKIWRPTYDIILQRICEKLDDLRVEFCSRSNYLEEPSIVDGGLVYKARVTIVVGWLCAYEIFQCLVSKNREPDRDILASVQEKFKDWSWYWGESATSYLLMVSLFLEIAGDVDLCWQIILKMLVEICTEVDLNSSDNGLADPYIPVENVLDARMPYHENVVEERQSVRPAASHHLATLVYYATILNKRAALNELWKQVSKIVMREFRPKNQWQYLLWRSEEGKEETHLFNATQSWSELREIAGKNQDTSPSVIYDNVDFLSFFLLVYPHRLVPELFRRLHDKVASIKTQIVS